MKKEKKLITILISFFVSIILVVFKLYLYKRTNSVAIFSDALESMVNVVASGFATISIYLATKPPDETHPYGHGKLEFFSGGFEGGLIILASYWIFKTGIERLVEPVPLTGINLGTVGQGIVVLINLTLGIWLIRVGRHTESIALEADGKHVLTDALTSVGVIVGFLLVKVTKEPRIDGIVACLIGINVIVMGTRLVWASVKGLLQAKDPRLLEEISEVLRRHRSFPLIDIHRLRAWRAGNEIFIDFHLILPSDLPLKEAHKEAKRLSRLLKNKFGPNTQVLIQLDPCNKLYCQVCEKNLETIRKNIHSFQLQWQKEDFTKEKEPL